MEKRMDINYLPDSPFCVHTERWRNGACIESLYYPDPLAGEDPSDRIQLLVTSAKGEPRGWLMNAQDAIAMIRTLSAALARALEPKPPLNMAEARAIKKELQTKEADNSVSKEELRLYLQGLMPCGHAVGNLLTCPDPPSGCVICGEPED